MAPTSFAFFCMKGVGAFAGIGGNPAEEDADALVGVDG
jgi:hypothetical protein